jgi:hypothetical protein
MQHLFFNPVFWLRAPKEGKPETEENTCPYKNYTICLWLAARCSFSVSPKPPNSIYLRGSVLEPHSGDEIAPLWGETKNQSQDSAAAPESRCSA